MRISQDRPKTDIGQRRWPYATGDQAEQQFPAPDNGCLAGSDLFQRDRLPGGYFAAELLNVPEETIRELVTHGGTISHQVEALALAGRGEFINLLDGTRASLEKLLDALWHCPPYNLMDKGQEQHTLEVMFSPASHNDLLKPASPVREFFFRYLVAAFSIPLGIQHCAVSARYYEEGYLRRLKKRTETFFAMAAHDCFNSEWFWDMMRDLPVPDVEPFTITPDLRSSLSLIHI